MSDIDWAYYSSISRQKLEVETARLCLEELRPSFILMDGSIVPHYSTRPSRSSVAYKVYQEMIEEYKKLFERCEEEDIKIIGVVEDSRGRFFCNFIKDEILVKIKHGGVPEMIKLIEKTRDSNLLHMLMRKGERTRVFDYSKTPEEHPVLRDMGEYGNRLKSYYLKTAKWDRPVRVDFLCEGEDAEEFADITGSTILGISGQHSSYGIPVPLIEADSIAKLSEVEIENFYSFILRYTGQIPSLLRLRRETRPF